MKKILYTLLILLAGFKAFAQDAAPTTPKTIGSPQIYYDIHGGDTTMYIKTPLGWAKMLRYDQGGSWFSTKFKGTGRDSLHAIDINIDSLNRYIGSSSHDAVIDGMQLGLFRDTILTVNAGTYSIGGKIYSLGSATYTPILHSDATKSRYETVYVDTLGATYLLAGPLSFTPVEQSIPAHTLRLGAVLITPGGAFVNSVNPPNPYNQSDSLTSDRTIFFSTHKLQIGDTAAYKSLLVLDPRTNTAQLFAYGRNFGGAIGIIDSVAQLSIGDTLGNSAGTYAQGSRQLKMEVDTLGQIAYQLKFDAISGKATFDDPLKHHGLDYKHVDFENLTDSTLVPKKFVTDYVAAHSGGAPTGAAGGDLSGTYPNPTVNQINSITKSYYDPTSSIQTQLNGKQASLGFTAENVANKATSFGTLNNTLYPTTQAVANYVAASSPVTSVFGRTGAVVAATNDYTFAQIGSKPTTLSGYGITDALSNVLTTTGDIIYSSSGATPARLAIGGANTVLHGGTTPSYSAIVNADITNSTIDLTTKVTGLLPASNTVNSGNTDMYILQLLGSSVKGTTIGQAIYSTNNPVTLTNQQLLLGAVYVPISATLTGIKLFINTAGSYTGNNENRVGLYSFNVSTGALTLVASSSNNSTLWTAAQGILTIPFSGTYAASAGVYFVGVVYSRSAETTAPKIYGVQPSLVVNGYDFANSVKITGSIASQTTLPSSVASSSIVANNLMPYVLVY